jgi:hypothetical protein
LGIKKKDFAKILFVGTLSQLSTVPRFDGTDYEGHLMKKKLLDISTVNLKNLGKHSFLGQA